VDEYLAALEPARREVLAAVRDLVLESLPPDFEEAFGHGMATWSVPLGRLPTTCNGEPLMLAALAAQKHHVSRYLMGLYVGVADDRSADFQRRWRATGRRLDMGKSCVRFRTWTASTCRCSPRCRGAGRRRVRRELPAEPSAGLTASWR